MSVYIIEYSHGTYVEITCQPEHKVHFYLCLKAVIIALIVTVGTIVVSSTPIQTGERIEIQIVVQTILIMRKQMRSTYSQQIEAYRRNISIQ